MFSKVSFLVNFCEYVPRMISNRKSGPELIIISVMQYTLSVAGYFVAGIFHYVTLHSSRALILCKFNICLYR